MLVDFYNLVRTVIVPPDVKPTASFWSSISMAVMFNFAFVLVRMKTLFSIGKASDTAGRQKGTYRRVGAGA
jgi:hypothetical protein